MKVTKLADLKRLPLGTKLRLTRSLLGPCNKLREVAKLQTNGMWFKQLDKPGDERLSWLDFPKAKDFQVTDKGFDILIDGRVEVTYEYVNDEVQVAA